jgi:hypothetical protein
MRQLLSVGRFFSLPRYGSEIGTDGLRPTPWAQRRVSSASGRRDPFAGSGQALRCAQDDGKAVGMHGQFHASLVSPRLLVTPGEGMGVGRAVRRNPLPNPPQEYLGRDQSGQRLSCSVVGGGIHGTSGRFCRRASQASSSRRWTTLVASNSSPVRTSAQVAS